MEASAHEEIADDAVAQSPDGQTVLVVGRLSPLAPQDDWVEGSDRWWSTEMANPDLVPLTDTPETDPETPYMIIYTSGTTGRPKGAVHVHGGFPIKGAQDLAHCFDLGPGDRLFWFTDLGWMMGPWAISGALLLGAELVLYEGAPDYPAPDRLWDIVARHAVTHLGLSPTVIRALMAYGTDPMHEHDLSSLRVLGSTGEPWNPESWWWFFNNVGGARLPLVNYSGGTEVSGGIVVVQPLDADQANIVRRPIDRRGRGRNRRGWQQRPRPGRRTRPASAVAGNDPWVLAGP